MTEFKKLFQPGKIGTLEIKNRIIMPAMAIPLGDGNGFVTERYMDHFVERAKGGVGMIITQHTPITPRCRGAKSNVGIWDDKFIPGFRRLVDEVHRHDTRIAIQIGHLGNSMSEPGRLALFGPGEEQEVVAPSPVPYVRSGVIPRELSREEIHELIELFAQASRRAQAAGFDAIEIHGAHGKLICQFHSPFYNKRTDEYGGSIENRARFGCEIIARIRKEVGPDFPVIIRTDGWDGYQGGLITEDAIQIAKMYVQAGVACLNVSAGANEGSHWQFLCYMQESGALVKYAEAIKKVVSVPVIAVGKIGDPALAESILQQGRADFVALGRSLLADAHWPEKVRNGHLDEVNWCIFCNTCMDRTLTHGIVNCAFNPSLLHDREYKLKLKPAVAAKRVMVVGGGLAGMKAAVVAAQRGHKVSLFEKEDRLGGQWNIACQQEHKKHFASVIRLLERELQKSGVEVVLKTKIDVAIVKKFQPDSVVIATGALPATLNVSISAGAYIVQAVDVITQKARVGKQVVIIGGRYVGMEVALDLTTHCERVSLVTRRQLGRDVEHNVFNVLREAFIKEGVYVYPFCNVVGISRNGVSLVADHAVFTLPADTVVLAVGSVAERKLYEELKGTIPEVYAIGDCVEPREALRAISEGVKIGTLI